MPMSSVMRATYSLLTALCTLLRFSRAQEEEARLGGGLPIVDLGYELHQAIAYNQPDGYYNFSNIRYAAPPVGNLRWRAPQAPKVDRKTVQKGEKAVTCPNGPVWWAATANEFLPAYLSGAPYNPTPRPPPTDEELTQQLPSATEDCLFLDVFAPKKVFDKAGRAPGAPVIVWLHGGGFAAASKTEGVWPSGLLKRAAENSDDSLILVSINYRIGVFGFLGGPTLQKDGIGNAGLYDQRFALEWVQANIKKFGGNPDRVTVMGNSAGGGSILHQITAYGGKPPRKTPFQKAIIQSPGFLPQPSPQLQQEVFDQFLSVANVKSLKEARALDSQALIRANSLQIGRFALYGLFIYGPTVDGVFAPALPGQLLASGRFDKSVQVMTGHNSLEGLIFTDPAIQDSNAFAAYLRRTFPKLPQASFDKITNELYPPIFDGSRGYTDQTGRVSLFIAEMTFVCNTYFVHPALHNDTHAYRFSVFPGVHAADLSYTFYRDEGESAAVTNATVARALQSFETSFAQTGTPRWSGLPQGFPKYGPDAQIIDLTQDRIYQTRDDAANERCVWWQKGLVA
ncbi:alpha/beta-hydrolase [Melanomma pulvis-pyrius CBS 109.77]|uniref:Carboxylic ester hydrolase n=1 Tax=Melanomma pulvis-pyrius CBS 109.77 TaxID=1314802 RepID=A0A6A6X1C7_9PLEO|nr:alpha/beta-hydrolase [Melanomma pulvis-pyrius CBS 109.77]